MQHIGKSKVTKLNAKAGVVYPLIRLPKTCADEIGEVAKIFEPQHHSRRALLVTFNDGEGPFEVIQLESKVIQLLPKVIQPEGLNNAESRLSALESQIAELKSLLLENENQKAPQSPLFRQSTPENRWARPDSNRRPPPCEYGGFSACTVVFRSLGSVS
jgi:predicted nucleic acid-binding Zn ribbon protein